METMEKEHSFVIVEYFDGGYERFVTRVDTEDEAIAYIETWGIYDGYSYMSYEQEY